MKKSFSVTAIIALSFAVAGIARATLLGVNVTPPIIVYANTGSLTTSYNPVSQIFTVTTTPTSIKFSATEPTFLILTPRSMKISIQVDNTGALVGGVSGPDLVISGRVQRVVGTVTNTYIGLLLTGEVTAFGYQDSGTTVDNYDFRFTPTGGLLQPFFQCDHIGVTLVSEGSTFTGLFTTNFNGQSKGNVGLEDQIPPTITCPFDNLNVTNVECSAQGGQAGAYVTFPNPVATDNCDTNVLITCAPTNGSFFALAPGTNTTSTLVTCTAQDAAGNTNSCSFTVTVVDDLAPEFDSNPVLDPCQTDALILGTDPGSCSAALTFPKPTATDSCCTSSVPVSVSAIDENGFIIPLTEFTSNNIIFVTGQFPQTCTRSNVITSTANDGRGNSAQEQCSLYVVDNEPPSILCPSNQTVSCTNGPVFYPDPMVSDNCTNVTFSCTPTNGSFMAIGSYLVTCTAVDGCGKNTNSCSFTLDVVDFTPPAITCPTNITIECGQSTDPSNTGTATASDDCDGNPSVTHADAVSGTCPVIIQRTWIAADHNGNTNTCLQTITVQDTSAPSVTVPAGSDLGCNPPSVPTVASVTALISVSDSCGVTSTNISYGDVTNSCSVTRTFTVTASDGCNTSSPKTIVYTWKVDGAAPTVTVPSGSNLGCNPTNLPTVASVTAQITVSDSCGVTSTNVSFQDSVNGCSVTRTFTVTASDACNTSSPKTVVYTWTADTTAPMITAVPGGGNLGCNPTNLPTDVSVKALVTATDNCGAPIVSVTHVDGGTACAPTRTFTVNAIDGCNNPAVPKTVVYTWTADTTAPSVTVPAGGDLGCSPTNNLPTDVSIKALVTVSDTCSAVTTTVAHVDTNINCRTTRTFTVTATDACNNTTTKTVAYTYGCAPCQPFEFNFQGNTALSGAVANVRSFVTNGVSVKVTAWSRVKTTGVWAPAYLGSYVGGLGVTDSSEADGSGNRHTIDNIDRDNYVLFEFSQPVVLDKAYLGYVVTDSDLKLWIGTFTDPYNNHLTLNDSVLSSFGYSETNMASNNATRWADVNAGATLGNAIVVAALPGVAETNDQFKIALFDVCKPVCQPLTVGCVAATTGQVGVYYSSAAVASGGVPPYTFSLYSGSIPPGLSGDTSAGTLFGTPTTAGTYTYVAQVTDSTGATALSSGCTITIAPACSASICGSVFLDCDGNGDLNGNEPGLSNSVVTLKSTSGTTLATAATDVNGKYCFFNLAAGMYVLSNAPTSFVQSGGTCTNHWSDSSGRDCWYDLDNYSHFRVLGTNCWVASDTYTHWQDLSTGLDTWKDRYGIKHTQTCYTSCDKITKTNTITVVVGTCQNKTGVNFAQKAVAPKITCTVTAPAAAKYGSTITYTCVVSNSGNACFSKGCKVTVWGGDIICPNLQPGQSCTVTKTHACPTSGSSVSCSVTAYGYHPTGTVTGTASCSTALSY